MKVWQNALTVANLNPNNMEEILLSDIKCAMMDSYRKETYEWRKDEHQLLIGVCRTELNLADITTHNESNEKN